MESVRNAVAVSLLAGSAAIVACAGELAPTSHASSSAGVSDPGSPTETGDTGTNTSASETTDTTASDAADGAMIDTSGIVVDASAPLIDAGVPFVAPVQPDAYSCSAGLSWFAVDPAEVYGSETTTVSATTDPPGATVVWSATATCVEGGTIGGFFGPDGGASSSGDSLSFSSGTCCAVITITAQTQLEIVPPGQDASINVCIGAAFASYSAHLADECSPGISCFSPFPTSCTLADGSTTCTDTQTDVANCGTCGTVCASGGACVNGTCN